MIASPMRRGALMMCVVALTSCATRAPLHSFQVLPRAPNYLLRYPDLHETPFSDVLRSYNGFEPGRVWMDLHPEMELRVENAYYRPGMPRKGLDGFIGTEIARYKVQSHGSLQLISFDPMQHRPSDQLPVQRLVSGTQRRYQYHRFYYAIFFKRSAFSRGSVLLGANSENELNRLAGDLITAPDSVCAGASAHCTVFPEACSVSIEMEVVVNHTPRNLLWGSLLSSVADHPRQLELLRSYKGRLDAVELDPRDPQALRLPLLPGDHVNWM